MKNSLLLKRAYFVVTVALLIGPMAFSQPIDKEAPKGFDQVRSGIVTGKLDSVRYESKTVGNKRNVLVYTPPGYSKKANQIPGAVFAARHWGRRKRMAEGR